MTLRSDHPLVSWSLASGAALLCAFGVWLIVGAYGFHHNAVKAAGTVVDVVVVVERSPPKGLPPSVSYRVVVEFRDQAGQVHRFQDNDGGSSHRGGEQVPGL